MLGERKSRERLVAVFVIGALLVNYPLLYLVADGVTWFGIPVLYVYLFGIWALLILMVGLVIERPGPAAREQAEEEEPR